ncbi:M10 family metallopeptidase C-terminal domain-containing protein [Yoonia sp.]|uniref:M10 family metallopeptidase C-terminal domain-containing protein n=1 Tax=Yoonia sp. TaxID=2212373 RepID=UPI0025E15D02|nr:M10 family metallopeptidase C-terminal domain-containing protein [Yoonia sp.]
MPDLPANSTTTATLTVGGTYTDMLEVNGDRDWVRIVLDPGEYVSISLNGQGLVDPYLRVYDANGDLVVQNDDGGSGLNSRAVVGSAAGSTYYIEAASFDDIGTGGYQLSAAAVPPPVPLDALDSGYQRTDTATPITVYFVPEGQSRDGVTSEGWTANEIQRFEAALASIAAVTNITFQTVTDPTADTTADFQVVVAPNPTGDNSTLAYFFYPSGSASSAGVFNSTGAGWNNTGGLEVGGLGFATIVHEVLHGLGLEHPHDGTVMSGVTSAFGDFGDFDLNQGIFTTMSYNAGYAGTLRNQVYGNEAGPMALDIAALQAIYGANTNYNTGANEYALPDVNTGGNETAWQAIWDAGGTDEISYGGTQNVTIDLREATLGYENGGGGFVSSASGISGGYTIANGVVIENATGGSGNDILIGNAAGNVLTGNAGTDDLTGGDGGDTLYGGADDDNLHGDGGNDSAFGGTGNDDISGGADNDTLGGNSGSDVVSGDSGTNTIYGNSGADDLRGGTGSDTIYGGSGNDFIVGNGSGDILFGGRGDDTLNGGSGSDSLSGGMGQDDLTGGAGSDTFVFAFVSDSWAGNADTIADFEIGIDLIDLSVIDANLGLAGNQAFSVVGGFNGTAGQIALDVAGTDTIVMIDRNGDGIAEMEIIVTGVTLTASDFAL